MLSAKILTKRIAILCPTLKQRQSFCVPFFQLRNYVSEPCVSIGNITKETKQPKRPEYVPRKYYKQNLTQSVLHHLKWMMQKDLLGQDIFLLGPPGPKKRHLAMQYLELTDREHEYVALNRDTTESDLKQRREILGGTAKYFDQSAVRAATEGRVLVLEGIEKAERNVLPVLNNLLENREMHLEDGRLLIPASRYDELLKEHGQQELSKWKLVRVDESFRVIALGLPIPRYSGNPLDPPLRSRFQARDVTTENYNMSTPDTTHWQSSVLPLFVRTVWTEGHHHVLLRQEDSIFRVKNFNKNKRKRLISDSSETESGFRLAAVKLPLDDLKNNKKNEQIASTAFIEPPICRKLIRCQLAVKPAIHEPPTPPPNNTISERVMVWLDLATNSGNAPKVEIVQKTKRAATAKPKKAEIVMSPKSPTKEKTCRIVEGKAGNDLGEVVTKVKRQVVGMKRELHIFMPKLPKKVGSDVSSVLSSKCSSLGCIKK